MIEEDKEDFDALILSLSELVFLTLFIIPLRIQS